MMMIQAIRRVLNQLGVDVRRFPEKQWSTVAEHYYPLNPKPRWGHGRPSHPQIHQFLVSQRNNFLETLNSFQRAKSHLESIPNDTASPIEAHWNNDWFSTLDAAALVSLIALKSPKRYVEIGGGNSTKFARHAINSAKTSTRIVSIDPEPRTDIDGLCDEVIRKSLETIEPSFFETLEAGDFLFFDGSHRVFTNSDVTAFFFDAMPRLKRGVIVHIHDIFWPDDYPPDWNKRLYSEQYLLGILWMSSQTDRYRVILPNYFVSHDPITLPHIRGLGIPMTYPRIAATGTSVWLQID